jgi:hypothetical protein
VALAATGRRAALHEARVGRARLAKAEA